MSNCKVERISIVSQRQKCDGYNSSNNYGQRKMLLTPKSVNDMLNTKVQRYWETPSQPGGSCGGEDEKAKIKVGKPKTHLMDDTIDISIKLVVPETRDRV
jgi:hypothetical protein